MVAWSRGAPFPVRVAGTASLTPRKGTSYRPVQQNMFEPKLLHQRDFNRRGNHIT